MTPIHYATMNNHQAVVEFLLMKESFIDCKDNNFFLYRMDILHFIMQHSMVI